ncbi:MAG: cysteine desulfurase [Chloroflexota bacterium]
MVEHIPTLPYDIESVRADFPILHQEHSPGKPLVYLDNAASSQRPVQVLEAMDTYYRTTHANVHRGIHKLSEAATVAYETARRKVQRFINAASDKEVIYTRGTTESINLVAFSWGRANLKPGDTVISTQMEHHANIVPWQMLAAERDIRVLYIPLQGDGTLDLDAYQRMLVNEPVKLVSVMHASNVLGTINPVQEMARMAHEHGALLLVDGAQSAPHLPVDVQALDVDFYAFSSHKMVGPTGMGILYGRETLLDAMPPWQGGGEMIERVTLEGSTWTDLPYKFEAGTPSIAEAVGLGAAVDYLTTLGMDKVHAHEQVITRYAMERLEEIPGVTVYGPDVNQRGAVTAFALKGIHPHDVAQMLDAEGVAVRSGHHCAQPLHDILGLPASARASYYLYNTLQEVDALVEAIYTTKRIFGV